MLISSKTTLCQRCFQTFGGQCICMCIYIYIYIYIYTHTLGVLRNIHTDTGISVCFACVPNEYSIVLNTARVKLHWNLIVLYIVTFDMKQSLIFQIMSTFSGNSNNKWINYLMWQDRLLYKHLSSNGSIECDHPFLFTTSFNLKFTS